VTLSRPFYTGVYTLTNAQWSQVLGSIPSKSKGHNLPVESVSWDEAMKFCETLSVQPEERSAGRISRLPTEAEWEYACQACTMPPYLPTQTRRTMALRALVGHLCGRKSISGRHGFASGAAVGVILSKHHSRPACPTFCEG